MFIQEILKFSAIYLLCSTRKEFDCAPYDPALSKLTTVYKFGSIYDYNDKHFTRPTKPLFPTPIYFNRQLDRFTDTLQKTSLTVNTNKFTYNKDATKNIKVNNEIPRKVLDDVDNNRKQTSNEISPDTQDSDDFTTESNFETSTYYNLTDDDYRFGGGIAEQHAFITLLGG